MIAIRDWGTCRHIFSANPDNVCLTFTAMVDVSNEKLIRKY